MERRNDSYLLVLSILLGISVLRLTEVFLLAEQVKKVLLAFQGSTLSVISVGVYLMIASYLVFFTLLVAATFGVARQMQSDSDATPHDMGPAIGLCVVSLTVAYLMVFAVAIYTTVGQIKP